MKSITLLTTVALSSSNATVGATAGLLRGVGGGDGLLRRNAEILKLFEILSNANDLMAGNLNTGTAEFKTPDGNLFNPNGFLPHNVQQCADVLSSQTESSFNRYGALELTGQKNAGSLIVKDPLTPPFDLMYEHYKYDPDSFFGKAMNVTVSRLDGIMQQLYDNNFIQLLGENHPMLMFDIDNTIRYSGFNDTDNTGDAPPITETVDFVKTWCDGWGARAENTPNTAVFDCYLVSASWCSEGQVDATTTFLETNFPDASKELVEKNVILTGAIVCECCDNFHNSWKDLIRCKIEDETNGRFVASIGDQYTDSAGSCSGLRIKVPNVWFDSSVVGNHQQYRQYSTEQLGANECSTHRAFGSAQGTNEPPFSTATVQSNTACLTEQAVDNARKYSTLGFCRSLSRANSVPNQLFGCIQEISSQPFTMANGKKATSCCFAEDEIYSANSCFPSS